MAALPEPPNDSHPPLWDYWRHDLWQRVVEGQDPYGFMGWPCIYHTMLQNHWPDVVHFEASDMLFGNEPWLPTSPAMPHPFYPVDYYSAYTEGRYSLNLIHQMYHLWKWQQVTGRKIADLDMIIEFGGGYGAMALVARRMGFRGSYFIQDLPEFELLQEFFLSNADPYSGTTFFSHGNTWIGDKPASLLIAGYSLSECDYSLRDKFLTENLADSYLLWYSDRFEDYDNVWYFQGGGDRPAMPYSDRFGQYYRKNWTANHMPPTTWYTVGWPA